MNLNLFTSIAAIGCLLFASCYPVNENPPAKTVAKKAPEKTATATAAADDQKLKDQEAAKKKEKEKEDLAQKDKTPEKTEGTTEKNPPEKTRGPETKKDTYPVAVRVPGKDNCVLSPYNNKQVLTLDENNKPIPPGTLVQDPSYPASDKKFFRVP